MDDLSLVYYGHVFDATGYGEAARGYVRALHAAGVRLSVVNLNKNQPQVRDDLVESLTNRRGDGDFHLFHGIPSQWARLAFPLRNAIGMTVWETDTMPLQWRNALSHVLEVWLPCEFNVAVFKRDLRTPIVKLPHVVVDRRVNGDARDASSFLNVTPDDFVVYGVFEWQERKCPHEVLSAYLQAFAAERDTVLIIKTNPGAADVAARALASARAQTSSQARISIRAEAWSEAELEAVHRRGDAYISLHRGEGWCYPLFEAASRGTPVVATAFGGPLEYLKPEFAHLVPYQLAPVRQPYLYYHPTMRWAQPEVGAASGKLRWIYEHRDEARQRAAGAVEQIRESYSAERVGATARDSLVKLLERTNAPRARRVRKAYVARQLRPPVPIPGEWYDRAYFEDGTKSNWPDGYGWQSFAGLFGETAAFLASTFADATSFLDVGCAKGFLVRALREMGKECWGVDHSPWALEQAEPAAAAYLFRARAEAIPFERRFDVVLAFDLLPHLTEEQASQFLSAAREWTDVALVAVIPSFETDEDERRHLQADDDADLSHILMRSRRWWHETFLRAGWRQDPLHRVVERMCRQHELTRKMRWQMYVYAPR
jgi:2-polyprenyl-3-methyl-5-hydroxy-6-metoxy-1,4-benzoquinol methylase